MLEKDNLNHTRKVMSQIFKIRFTIKGKQMGILSKDMESRFVTPCPNLLTLIYLNEGILQIYMKSLPFQGIAQVTSLGKCFYSVTEYSTKEVTSSSRVCFQFKKTENGENQNYPHKVWRINFMTLLSHKEYIFGLTSLDLSNTIKDFLKQERKILYPLTKEDSHLSRSEMIKCFATFIKNCESVDSMTVYVNPLPDASFATAPVVCSGDSGTIEVTFTGTAPFSTLPNN